jgi:flagellar basal body rod protein FlgC
MDTAMNIAASGMQTATRAFNTAASNVVQATSASNAKPASSAQGGGPAAPVIDLPSQLVAQSQASASFRANLTVFRAAEKNYKALLDATV